ncbi:sugar ABC transporter ATP-binding protein [Candidatus Aerophobetes bacterium]|nr:sugar ABC transporter ATP-binding protein [Candidatus Aerophobetes bacterium]
MKSEPLLRMSNICKNFGEIRALNNVNLVLNQGDILGLVGDNAAGKSTLMKILSGTYIPDKGEIFFEGRKVEFRFPRDSRKLGIEMIYQDLAVADNMDIVENIFLGVELERPTLGGLIKVIDRKRMERESWETLEKIRINIDSVNAKVETLSGGQRQSVAIARTIRSNAKVIIMDEPTASLGVSEVEMLLGLIRELKTKNTAIVFVSHRLYDVFEVGDRIMVLRHGECVEDKKIGDTDMDEIRKLMIGES